MSHYEQVAIVGVGLIGGSIGLALKERGLARQVVGIGRRQESLDKALAVGAIDMASIDLEAGVDSAEVVVIASPVSTIAEFARRALAAAPQSAVVTDAGSTKAEISCVLSNSLDSASARFVGSHPLAGDHRTGPEFALANLFEDRTVVTTPLESSSPEAIAKVESFWQNLGARVVKMEAAEHDRALATTSHLPHMVASALASITPQEWLPLTAGGWQDTTRVAAADPELWTQIFAQNKSAVLEAIRQVTAELEKLTSNLEEEDWDKLQATLHNAKRIRDALGN